MNWDDQKFVRQLFGWVLHAQRFLKMAELREILRPVIGPKSTDTDANLQLYAKWTVYACGGFISYDPRSDVVTVSHVTVQECLEKNILTSCEVGSPDDGN